MPAQTGRGGAGEVAKAQHHAAFALANDVEARRQPQRHDDDGNAAPQRRQRAAGAISGR
jgi:hypothetical protein